MRAIRQCYVCSLFVPMNHDVEGWEAFRDDDGIRMQYRCPKHRVRGAKQIATLGESRKVQLSSLYGKFGKRT